MPILLDDFSEWPVCLMKGIAKERTLKEGKRPGLRFAPLIWVHSMGP